MLELIEQYAVLMIIIILLIIVLSLWSCMIVAGRSNKNFERKFMLEDEKIHRLLVKDAVRPVSRESRGDPRPGGHVKGRVINIGERTVQPED